MSLIDCVCDGRHLLGFTAFLGLTLLHLSHHVPEVADFLGNLTWFGLCALNLWLLRSSFVVRLIYYAVLMGGGWLQVHPFKCGGKRLLQSWKSFRGESFGFLLLVFNVKVL